MVLSLLVFLLVFGDGAAMALEALADVAVLLGAAAAAFIAMVMAAVSACTTPFSTSCMLPGAEELFEMRAKKPCDEERPVAARPPSNCLYVWA
jgi:hypothetical protein